MGCDDGVAPMFNVEETEYCTTSVLAMRPFMLSATAAEAAFVTCAVGA